MKWGKLPPDRPFRDQKEFIKMLKFALIAFVLTVATLSAPASAYTQNEQQACQDDAFRLCNHAIPDEQKVKACFIANMRKLSPGCRKVFQRPRHR
jgi:hypothetical protein